MSDKTAPGKPHVGSQMIRTDGRDKVLGLTQYVDDEAFSGWHGATVRSPVARGRIRSIRFLEGPDWRQFVIVDARDIPRFAHSIHGADASHGPAEAGQTADVDLNIVKMIVDDQPYLVRDEIRHKHEAVVLLAHPDRDLVRWAATRVHIEVEPLPAVLDYRQQASPAQIQHGKDNIFKAYSLRKGAGEQEDLWQKVLADATHVVSGVYETGAQEQAYIEPQGIVAHVELAPEDEAHGRWPQKPFHVHIRGSMQCPYYVHNAMKHLFNQPDDRIQIVQTATGGGFGGKEDYPSIIAGHAALLSWKARQPVKMIYDRVEDMQSTTKRHPCQTRLTTALDAQGRLLALEAQVLMDGGAYVTLSPVVLSRGTIHAAGPYSIDHVRIDAKVVLSNTAPNGAFRGFGAPQTIFAMERHLDRCAKQVGISPAEIRRQNLIEPGQSLATGQVIREPVALRQWMQQTMDALNYEEKRANYKAFNDQQLRTGGPLRRGVGLATFMHGCGFTGSGEVWLDSIVKVRVASDGVVEVCAANTEMGQGAQTVFTAIAADALGLDTDQIRVIQPDTDQVPNSGPTVASRTSMVVGHLVAKACDDLVRQVEEKGLLTGARLLPSQAPISEQSDGRGRRYAAADLQAALRQLPGLQGWARYQPPPGVIWDDQTYKGVAYGTYGWACYAADVQVDTTTMEVRLLDFVAGQEVGRVLHPLLAAGQIIGGVVQGIGWALWEDVVLDAQGGMANANLTTYVLPTMADVPEIRTLFQEQPYGYGPFGAKGIGELPMDGPAPAVINAVAMALDCDICSIPATPERLLELSMRPEGTSA